LGAEEARDLPDEEEEWVEADSDIRKTLLPLFIELLRRKAR